jgi:hypothetical protein
MGRKRSEYWKAIEAMREGDERVYSIDSINQVRSCRAYLCARINRERQVPIRLTYSLDSGTMTLRCEAIVFSKDAMGIIAMDRISTPQFEVVAREGAALMDRLKAKVAEPDWEAMAALEPSADIITAASVADEFIDDLDAPWQFGE